MSRKKRKRGTPSAGPSGTKAEEIGSRSREPGDYARENDSAGDSPPITQYIFTFELIRQYPTVRSFIVKQPLKRSFKDTMSELFGGNKKGVYRI